jgi:hypothetical protein
MWTDKLRILDACDVAIRWASAYPTAQAAWDECSRPGWMIWLALKTGVSEQVVKRVAVRMAPLVRHQVFEMDAAWAAADAVIAVWTFIRYAAGAARNDTYRRCADVIRELIPVVPLDPGPRVELKDNNDKRLDAA